MPWSKLNYIPISEVPPYIPPYEPPDERPYEKVPDIQWIVDNNYIFSYYFPDSVIESLTDFTSKNIIGVVLPEEVTDSLKPYKESIMQIGKKDVPLDEKRKILLEKGGEFLRPLIQGGYAAANAKSDDDDDDSEDEEYTPETLSDLELIVKNSYFFLDRFPDRVAESVSSIAADFFEGNKPSEKIMTHLNPHLETLRKIADTDVSLDEKRNLLRDEGENFLHPLIPIMLSTVSEREILSEENTQFDGEECSEEEEEEEEEEEDVLDGGCETERLADLELIVKNTYTFLPRFPNRMVKTLRIVTAAFLKGVKKPTGDVLEELKPFTKSIRKIANKNVSLCERRRILIQEGEYFLYNLLQTALSTSTEREILSEEEIEYPYFNTSNE